MDSPSSPFPLSPGTNCAEARKQQQHQRSPSLSMLLQASGEEIGIGAPDEHKAARGSSLVAAAHAAAQSTPAAAAAPTSPSPIHAMSPEEQAALWDAARALHTRLRALLPALQFRGSLLLRPPFRLVYDVLHAAHLATGGGFLGGEDGCTLFDPSGPHQPPVQGFHARLRFVQDALLQLQRGERTLMRRVSRDSEELLAARCARFDPPRDARNVVKGLEPLTTLRILDRTLDQAERFRQLHPHYTASRTADEEVEARADSTQGAAASSVVGTSNDAIASPAAAQAPMPRAPPRSYPHSARASTATASAHRGELAARAPAGEEVGSTQFASARGPGSSFAVGAASSTAAAPSSARSPGTGAAPLASRPMVRRWLGSASGSAHPQQPQLQLPQQQRRRPLVLDIADDDDESGEADVLSHEEHRSPRYRSPSSLAQPRPHTTTAAYGRGASRDRSLSPPKGVFLGGGSGPSIAWGSPVGSVPSALALAPLPMPSTAAELRARQALRSR